MRSFFRRRRAARRSVAGARIGQTGCICPGGGVPLGRARRLRPGRCRRSLRSLRIGELEGLVDNLDLRDALDGVDAREQTIIYLKFFSGLSQSAIAQRLGISQMHVSRLQRNALSKLKLSLFNDPVA